MAGLRRLNIFLIVLLGGLVCAIALMAGVPPVSRDALTAHLYVPRLYLQKGGMYEIPSVTFSYYPMNLEMLYWICLYFKNDILPKYIHFMFGLITAGMIYAYLKKRLNPTYAILGVLFFLSIPIIVNLSTTAYVDLGLICFSFASLLCLFKWIENGFLFKWLIACGVFCGLAIGTKYNGLITLFLLACFIPFIYARSRVVDRFKALRAFGFGALFILVAALIYSPWGVRNYIWTENPIYPLFEQQIQPEHQPEAQQDDRIDLDRFKIRKYLYNESWWEVLLVPVRIFFQGKDGNPEYFDGRLNPFLFFLPFLAFFLKTDGLQEEKEKRILLSFSVLFILFGFAGHTMRIRYISPVVPPLVILSMFGLAHLVHFFNRPPWLRFKIVSSALIVFLLGICFSFNAEYIVKRYEYIRPIPYITGRISRDAYIQRYCPEYSVYQYVNVHLPEDIKILGIYLGNRGYYIHRPIVFDLKMLPDAARESMDAGDIEKKLQQEKIGYLIINYSLFNFYTKKSLDQNELENLGNFFHRYTKRVYTKHGVGLYKLL